jgi:hypothetical protein
VGRPRRHVAEAADLGELKDGLDPDFATQLVALIDRLSAERVLYPGQAPWRIVSDEGAIDQDCRSVPAAG